MRKNPDLLRKRLDAKEKESEQRTVVAMSGFLRKYSYGLQSPTNDCASKASKISTDLQFHSTSCNFTETNRNLTMNFTGLLVGLSTFLIIGLFHPLVIKAEYYIGVKSWIIFAIAGIVFGIASIMVSHLIWSTILGVVAFSSFWSILEVIHQRERVRKGWFPEGPGHKK